MAKAVFKFEGTIGPVEKANPQADLNMQVGEDHLKMIWDEDTIYVSFRISEGTQIWSALEKVLAEFGK